MQGHTENQQWCQDLKIGLDGLNPEAISTTSSSLQLTSNHHAGVGHLFCLGQCFPASIQNLKMVCSTEMHF